MSVVTISITPWKVISKVTFTASEELFTGLTSALVKAKTLSSNSFSSIPEAPKLSNKLEIKLGAAKGKQYR